MAKFYKADLQKGRKGAELSGAIAVKGGKSYARNRKRRQIDKGAK